MYQIQNGKPKLIAYASKKLPETAHNYSITELEMCGLAINIVSFAHLLRCSSRSFGNNSYYKEQSIPIPLIYII